MSSSPDQILTELRVDIDRIDAAMHALLMERGGIIERLIAVKARQGGGSAFRPGREAEMMRRIAERHAGPLPLDTVESIWRVIISTFTYVQAPYAVHADEGAGSATMRDSARFHFGFTVPLHAHGSASGVIDAVMAADSDLGLLAVAPDDGQPAWWSRLAAPGAPKIIARLPFVERPDHPAGRPVFVIAKPSAAAAVRDVALVLVRAPEGDPAPATTAVHGARTVGVAGRERLLSVPGQDLTALLDHLRHDRPQASVTEIGSHAARFAVSSDPARAN